MLPICHRVQEVEVADKVRYTDMMFDCRRMLSTKLKRRTKQVELAAMLGYKAASAISPWVTGLAEVRYAEPKMKIQMLHDALEGKIELPFRLSGSTDLRSKREVMRAWYDAATAAQQAKEAGAAKRVAEVAAGYSLRHVLKSQDQLGAQQDVVVAKLDVLGMAVGRLDVALNELLKEWRSTRGDS